MSHLHAACVAGRLVAQGLLATAEILPPILAQAGPRDRAIILARFTASRDAMLTERRRTAAGIRAALAPLIAGHAAGRTLLAAASHADAARALLAHERRRIAEQLIRHALERTR